MFLTRPMANTETERNDKHDILELVCFERFCRDNSLWDEMRKCFSEDSYVNLSWYQGSGDGFVKKSMDNPANVPHHIYNNLTWVNGERAVTVMTVTIHIRVEIQNVECEVSTDSKLIYCTKKINGQWYIARLEAIYDSDRLVPVTPDNTLSIPHEILLKYRRSYACLSYYLDMSGMSVNYGLAGSDCPETVDELYRELDMWLREESSQCGKE